ncbi:MAG: hypothetical protein H7Z37_03195 [Pyrinomonadaceae bacterium]|nr:hypothetical protein [Pyrinomonadaceae bacterium]
MLSVFAQTADDTSDGGMWIYLILFGLLVISGAAYFFLRKKSGQKSSQDSLGKDNKSIISHKETNVPRRNSSREFDINRNTSDEEVEARIQASIGGKQQTPTKPTQNPSFDGVFRNPESKADLLQMPNNYVSHNGYASNAAQPTREPNSINSFQHLNPSQPVIPLPLTNDDEVLEAIECLHQELETEGERETVLNILAYNRTRNAIDALSGMAHYDESTRLRVAAVSALGDFDHESVFEPILLACIDPAREVRAAAARILTRLSFDRADAYVRVIESKDPERIRLAALACVEAGLATRAFDRLAHPDQNQAYEGFAILNILVRAQRFDEIITTIERHPNVPVRVATVKVVKNLKVRELSQNLSEIFNKNDTPPEVKAELAETIEDLAK